MTEALFLHDHQRVESLDVELERQKQQIVEKRDVADEGGHMRRAVGVVVQEEQRRDKIVQFLLLLEFVLVDDVFREHRERRRRVSAITFAVKAAELHRKINGSYSRAIV